MSTRIRHHFADRTTRAHITDHRIAIRVRIVRLREIRCALANRVDQILHGIRLSAEEKRDQHVGEHGFGDEQRQADQSTNEQDFFTPRVETHRLTRVSEKTFKR